jgi:hypothetical protein
LDISEGNKLFVINRPIDNESICFTK